MKLRVEITIALLVFEKALSDFLRAPAGPEKESALRIAEAKRDILQQLINCVDTEL